MSMAGNFRTFQCGATLVELIISIVVLSVSAVGIMMVITQTTISSANPMIRAQGTAIAQAYMEEILSKRYPAPGDNGPETGESRSNYDDVADYNGLSDTMGARDHNGTVITGLEGYNVAVSVSSTTLNGTAARRILVTVTYDGLSQFSLPLAAYRLL